MRKLDSALPALLGVRYMVKKAQHERIVVMMNLCEGVVSGCLCSLSVFVAATFEGSTRLLFDGARPLGDFFKCSKCSFRIPAISISKVVEFIAWTGAIHVINVKSTFNHAFLAILCSNQIFNALSA